MSVAPDPFWIITFSQPELWRSLASEDQIALVLNRFPAETVDQIAAQLPRLAAEDRRAGLPHLLRHWATSRLRGAEISTSALDAKETRKRVIELRRAMLKTEAKFRALSDEGVMMLSRELEGPQPVTKAHQLQRDFVALADSRRGCGHQGDGPQAQAWPETQGRAGRQHLLAGRHLRARHRPGADPDRRSGENRSSARLPRSRALACKPTTQSQDHWSGRSGGRSSCGPVEKIGGPESGDLRLGSADQALVAETAPHRRCCS